MFHWLRASGSFHSYCRPCHAAYMAERYRRLQDGRREVIEKVSRWWLDGDLNPEPID